MKLETSRLILREWTVDDVDDLIDGLNDLSVSKWLAFVPHPYTEKNGGQWIDYCTAINGVQSGRSSYEFAVELKAEQKVIGGVSLTRISQLHGTAGGGIWISAKYQGRGFGTEAFAEKIRFAFEDLGLRRLENGFFDRNETSLRMQQRFGYKLEGRRRKAFCCLADGLLKDECITGLLKEEWIRKT